MMDIRRRALVCRCLEGSSVKGLVLLSDNQFEHHFAKEQTMAGYYLNSLDSEAFQKFCTEPSDEQLLSLARKTSDLLDLVDVDSLDGETLSTWPVVPEELVPILRERMTQDDWFERLEINEKAEFDVILRSFFCESDNGLDFHSHSDTIYWNVIELIRAFHQIPANAINEWVISRFGTKPLHATLEEGKIPGYETWAPYFSMHLPDDVRRLRDEVLSAESAVIDSGDSIAINDYEDTLVPVLESLVEDQRILFVILDT